MTSETVGLIGIVVLIILLFCGMKIGMAMALVGFLGSTYLVGIDRCLGILSTVPYSTVAFYPVTVVPLFTLMGTLVSTTGVSADLYDTAYKWAGHLKGGLAIATISACAAFAAITGSSVTGTVTLGKVALPEMKKYKYDMALATGSIASGGTLGILIPPSLGFILYGIMTEESIGKLFMAGILPGILLTLLFIIVIIIITMRSPKAGPPGPGTTFKEKVISLKKTWPMVALFLLVLGGIYLGVFTPTEAGAIGAFGAIVITLINRKLTYKSFMNALLETGQITALIMLLVVGSFIMMRFLSLSKLPNLLAETVSSLAVPKYFIFAVIIVFYLILGMFLEIMSAIVLTIPFIYPVILALGFDPIWFGVIAVILMEMGLITPPVGMNAFALAGVCDIPLNTIFRGNWPFVGAMMVCLIILTFFPVIATFIPSIM
jgi:C4-dicarboxylate transporter DctM subunit